MFAITKAGRRKKKLAKVNKIAFQTRGNTLSERQLGRLTYQEIDMILAEQSIPHSIFYIMDREPYISERGLRDVDTSPRPGDRIEPRLNMDEVSRHANEVRDSMRSWDTDSSRDWGSSSGSYSSGSSYSSDSGGGSSSSGGD